MPIKKYFGLNFITLILLFSPEAFSFCNVALQEFYDADGRFYSAWDRFLNREDSFYRSLKNTEKKLANLVKTAPEKKSTRSTINRSIETISENIDELQDLLSGVNDQFYSWDSTIEEALNSCNLESLSDPEYNDILDADEERKIRELEREEADQDLSKLWSEFNEYGDDPIKWMNQLEFKIINSGD